MTAIKLTPVLREINQQEALRYMGCTGADDPRLAVLVARAAEETKTAAAPAACYMQTPLQMVGDNRLDFGFIQIQSAALARHLRGCTDAYWFAATVGVQCDRAIYRASLNAPAYSLALDACGSAAIEGICDWVSNRLAQLAAEENLALRPRFSPGYGDFPLACQPQILAGLDATRKIGLACTESLMMTPVKSVTAVIGRYKQ